MYTLNINQKLLLKYWIDCGFFDTRDEEYQQVINKVLKYESYSEVQREMLIELRLDYIEELGIGLYK